MVTTAGSVEKAPGRGAAGYVAAFTQCSNQVSCTLENVQERKPQILLKNHGCADPPWPSNGSTNQVGLGCFGLRP